MEGGVNSHSSRYISFPASSVRRRLSSLRITFIAQPSIRMWAWYLAGSWSTENLSSKSLHVYANTHAFFLASLAYLASLALGLEMDLLRAAKITSSLVGMVRGRRGICVRLSMYSVCYLRGALRRHPRTN